MNPTKNPRLNPQIQKNGINVRINVRLRRKEVLMNSNTESGTEKKLGRKKRTKFFSGHFLRLASQNG